VAFIVIHLDELRITRKQS